VLARAVPERVLIPLAADAERGWVLLPDGGPSLGERADGRERAERLAGALARYGELQRVLAPRVGELLAIGLPDMRPAVMPERFRDALAAVRAEPGGAAVAVRVAALEGTVAGWCERLAASRMGVSLDDNDLHAWNVLGDEHDPRYYDWGDSVVAHPFAAALVPLGQVAPEVGDAGVARARDRYLDAFADLAPRTELRETLEIACRVAKVARVLTWERALRAAREQGEPVDPAYAGATVRTLSAVLDESYLGGA